MAIVIKKIVEVISEYKLKVQAQHHEELLTVYLSDESNSASSYLNTEITFEMNYEEVLSWGNIDNCTNENSGLYNGSGDSIVIRGLVHNIISTDDDNIIDIYIAAGAEFITITSSEINNYIPKVGEWMELNIKGLCVYPVHY